MDAQVRDVRRVDGAEGDLDATALELGVEHNWGAGGGAVDEVGEAGVGLDEDEGWPLAAVVDVAVSRGVQGRPTDLHVVCRGFLSSCKVHGSQI